MVIGIFSLCKPALKRGMVTLLAVGLLLIASAESQTQTGQPATINSYVMSVTFGVGDTAWVVTPKEGVLRTTDGGATWTIVSGKELGSPKLLSFINANQGWSVDNQGNVQRTRDGGMKWQHISNVAPDEDPNEVGPVKQIKFIDELKGWILDPFTVWRTTDGGITWNEQLSLTYSYLHFLDGKLGWIESDGGVLYGTLNGGEIWQKLSTDRRRGAAVCGISFINETEGWIGTRKDNGIFHTTDGGKNWVQQTLPVGELMVTSIKFLSEKEGWATALDFKSRSTRSLAKSILLQTVDGGQSWQIANTSNAEGIYNEVHFSERQHGWLYTDVGLYRTVDGGHIWKLVLRYSSPPPIRRVPPIHR